MPSYKASEPSTFDCLPAGEYNVEIVNAAETFSQKQHEMIELKLKAEPSGAVIFDHLVFMPNAFWKIDSFRAATGEVVTPGEDVEIIADELIGRQGRVRLVVEEYNGRKRNKVAAWLPAPKPGAADPGVKGGIPDANRPF